MDSGNSKKIKMRVMSGKQNCKCILETEINMHRLRRRVFGVTAYIVSCRSELVWTTCSNNNWLTNLDHNPTKVGFSPHYLQMSTSSSMGGLCCCVGDEEQRPSHVYISPHCDKTVIAALSPTFQIQKLPIINSAITATAATCSHAERVQPLHSVISNEPTSERSNAPAMP